MKPQSTPSSSSSSQQQKIKPHSRPTENHIPPRITPMRLRSLQAMVKDDICIWMIQALYVSPVPIDSDTLREMASLTKKQFYNRLARLRKANLIMSGHHTTWTLTTFAKFLVPFLERMNEVEKQELKFKMLDVMLLDKNITPDEFQKAKEKLFEDSPMIRKALSKVIKLPLTTTTTE